jgi:hypothetical protein
MKIALLFRGPLRPNPSRVLENTSHTIKELTDAGHEVHTFLATWPSYNGYNAQEIIDQKVFDHYIIQQEPSNEYIEQFIHRRSFEGCHSTIYNVFKMYIQSKHAIETIINTDTYDRIVHSRTDNIIKFGQYLNTWLEKSESNYVRKRCDAAWWINDTIGMANPSNMQKAWNWNNVEDLGSRIDKVRLPEEVLMGLMSDAGVSHVPEDTEQMILDPTR